MYVEGEEIKNDFKRKHMKMSHDFLMEMGKCLMKVERKVK